MRNTKLSSSNLQVQFGGLLMATAIIGSAANSIGAGEGTSILFNGKDLQGWRKPTGEWVVAKEVSLNPTNAEKFIITPGEGVLVNGPKGKTTDLSTAKEFGDI